MPIAPIPTLRNIRPMKLQVNWLRDGIASWLGGLFCWVALAAAAQPTVARCEEHRMEPTKRGVYRVELKPQDSSQPVPVGSLHAWVVTVETAAGERFIPGQITIGGGMPAHGHGLPSAPVVTRHLGAGRFLIEGMLFNMTGRWKLQLAISGPAGLDHYTQSLQVAAAPVAAPSAKPSTSAVALSAAEVAVVQSLSLAALGEPANTADNALLEDPEAITLGKRLFADVGLSASGTVSCSTCHQPERAFTDGRARAFGTALGVRNAPSLIGVRHSPWLYWDGRRDSLWSQALTPFETRGEMDNNRTDVVRYVVSNAAYRKALDQWSDSLDRFEDGGRFPSGAGPYADAQGKTAWQRMAAADRALVDSVFVLLGKALAAFESTLQPTPTRFDAFADSLGDAEKQAATDQLTDAELRGLKLFIDPERSRCLQCHNGPLFTNQGFHNIGTGAAADGGFDYGRAFGLQTALFNPFNCRSEYSDNGDCPHVVFAQTSEQPGSMNGAFKVPGLRNLTQTGPYLHDGRHQSLAEVLRWYNEPPDAAESGHELVPLQLEEAQLQDLEAFLLTLSQQP